MTYAPYLRSIARALTERVHPAVTDARSRDALEACIRAIAGAAVTIDTLPEGTAPKLPEGLVLDPNVVFRGPPENPAVTPATIAAVAAGADWLAQGDWIAGEGRADARRLIGWERQMIDDRVARMFALEAATAPSDTPNPLLIDPAALERRLGGRVIEFRQAIGGRSRQTALFTLEGRDDLPARLVVQRDHPASISPKGVTDEFPLLQRLSQAGLRVARPVLLETDRDVLGAPFMLLEQCPGTVAGPDYFQPPKSPALALDLARQLAALHAVDPGPLADRMTGTAQTGGWSADLDRIEAGWNGMAHTPSLTVSAALAWMRANVDRIGNDTVIVHNDAAFHNILVKDDSIVALLDWELAHLGHPAEDLGYCRPFIQEMADWDAFLAAYVAAGGRAFAPAVIDWFSLRGTIHLMTLIQYGRSMFETGVTTDINLAEVGTSFIPKLMRRIANVVDSVLADQEIPR